MKYPCLDCGGTGAVPNSSSNTGASKCLECKGTGKTNKAPRKRETKEPKVINTLSYRKGNLSFIFNQYENGEWLSNGISMTNLEVMKTTNKLIAEGWA